MKILLTGANGYIGKRLLPKLIGLNHQVVCAVRDKSRFAVDENFRSQVEVIEIDVLKPETLSNIPFDIDGAYYLIHSMSSSSSFEQLEAESARNFKAALNKTKVKHLIYLSGIVNDDQLSKHLQSRKKVEDILATGNYAFTTLRAGIIIGSGSASFEIVRDLVEKLPVMLTPKWILTKSQPIAIRDILQYLSKSLFSKETYGKSFDIGGPDVLTYKDMMLQFAKIRKLSRLIITIPIMTPRLSSYWLYFVTSTSYKLAINLVNSMKVEVICKPNNLAQLLNITPTTYRDAISHAFLKIEQNEIVSSWKDSMSSSHFDPQLSKYIQVPEFGCYRDVREMKITDPAYTLSKIWSIGGDNGWYYADWLWQIRGIMDKFSGGIGLRRGRTNKTEIQSGDSLDFWRVLFADKKTARLLLYAEMKLPGEAWLEFKIKDDTLFQTATFRPKGLAGRLYWYSVKPFHNLIFKNMMDRIGRQ
ncbi:MAG TPA: SDR family oxidoreductase [Bacteroidales bacterium]